jgi:hypothetical protein
MSLPKLNVWYQYDDIRHLAKVLPNTNENFIYISFSGSNMPTQYRPAQSYLEYIPPEDALLYILES